MKIKYIYSLLMLPLLVHAQETKKCIDQYKLHASGKIQIADRSLIEADIYGDNITVGNDTKIRGLVVAKSGLNFGERIQAKGMIQWSKSFVRGRRSVIASDVERNAHNYGCESISALSKPGQRNIEIKNAEGINLEPGQYGSLVVRSGGRILINSGDFHFSELILEPNSTLEWQTSADGDNGQAPTNLYIKGNIQIGDRATFVGYSPMTIHGEKNATIGTDVQLIANINVPNGFIRVGSRTELHKSLSAKDIQLEPDVGVTALRVVQKTNESLLFGKNVDELNWEEFNLINYQVTGEEAYPKIKHQIGLSNGKDIYPIVTLDRSFKAVDQDKRFEYDVSLSAIPITNIRPGIFGVKAITDNSSLDPVSDYELEWNGSIHPIKHGEIAFLNATVPGNYQLGIKVQLESGRSFSNQFNFVVEAHEGEGELNQISNLEVSP